MAIGWEKRFIVMSMLGKKIYSNEYAIVRGFRTPERPPLLGNLQVFKLDNES